MTTDASVQRAALAKLAEVEPDGQPQTVRLPRFGTYRVAALAMPDGRLVSGLPQSRVDDAVASLVQWELVLVLLALSAAGTAAVVLVRRQLEPLRHVAATAEEVSRLPLSSGEVDLAPRVADPDENSEVVASAFGTRARRFSACAAATPERSIAVTERETGASCWASKPSPQPTSSTSPACSAAMRTIHG